jgi:hypothetical protein
MRADPEDEVLTTMVTPVITESSTVACRHETAQQHYDDIGNQIREAW